VGQWGLRVWGLAVGFWEGLVGVCGGRECRSGKWGLNDLSDAGRERMVRRCRVDLEKGRE